MDSLFELESFVDEFAKYDPSYFAENTYGETFQSNWEGNKYFENENHSFGKK